LCFSLTPLTVFEEETARSSRRVTAPFLALPQKGPFFVGAPVFLANLLPFPNLVIACPPPLGAQEVKTNFRRQDLHFGLIPPLDDFTLFFTFHPSAVEKGLNSDIFLIL